MNYLQQDALKKLREATISASVAQKNARRDFEKAQAELDEWTKRYELALQESNKASASQAKFQKERYQAIADRLKNLIEEQQPQIDNIKGKLESWGERLSEERNTVLLPEFDNNTLSDFNSIRNKCLESQTNAEEVSQSYNTIEESIDDELKRLKSELLNKNQYEAKEQTSELNQIKRNFNYHQNQVSLTSIYIQQPQQKNIGTGVGFISAGTIAGASLSSTIGGMGLAGGFGAVGIGAAPLVCAGAVTGAAAYGAVQAIQGDTVAMSAIAIGSIGGASASSLIGTMGLVAPKIGLAVGIGTIPMAAIGGVVGLAAYGVAKMFGKTAINKTSAISETPIQAFERIEEKILEMDFYYAAKQELQAFLSGDDLNPQFAAIEIEDELQKLKKQLLTDKY